MNTRTVLTGLFLGIVVVAEGTIALSGKRDRSSVTVLARGPAGLRIQGTGTEVSLEEDPSALTFKVPLTPIETGIGLRDLQMHKLLEADKYPNATLRVARSALKFPEKAQPTEGTADGDLTLHGQSRPVKVRYRAELGAHGVTKVVGSLQLDLRDFDIQAPSYLGVTVAPKVEVKAELALEDA